MRKVIHILLTGLILSTFWGFLEAREPLLLNFGLKETEQKTLNNSPRLKAAEFDALSSDSQSQSVKYQGLPRLVLEGSYRYLSVIPEMELPIRGLSPVELGDHKNYSLGPALYWTVWDRGGIRNSYLSLDAQAKAKKYEADGIKRQLLLAARIAYFQLGASAEQVTLLSDSLKLAQSQYDDIRINVRAGTKSRMDELAAHQNVLLRMKQLRSARADMADALEELSALTAETYAEDALVPFTGSAAEDIPKEITEPNAFVRVETADDLISGFAGYEKLKLWKSHPNIEMISELSESARLASLSASSGLWPKLQLSAKSSIEYPNGPALEQINQNSIGASLSWVLFEGGLSSKKAKAYELSGKAGESRKEQALIDLEKEWRKAKSQLANLEEQKDLDEQSIREARELADITYRSYKTGSVNYLDVESADHKLLETKIQSAKTKYQMLINLAVLASLAE